MMLPLVTHIGPAPVRQNRDDAGYDLVAAEHAMIEPGRTFLVKTGLKMALPPGTAGLVCSRSGLALKHSVFVLNAPGVVDAGYRGDVGVILHNAGHQSFYVNPGDRIAQLLIVPTVAVEWQQALDLDETDRGSGGFGSTGV
jgi:dUTP pyrophosphatase